MSIRSVLLYVLIIVVVGVLVLSPLKLPFSVSAYGKIVPAKKWVLTKGNDGQLTSSQFNYENGINEGYRTSQFAREGAMQLTISPSIVTGSTVAAGDTVGIISSTETMETLIDLKGQLASARAELQTAITGEKKSVIDECRQKLAWSKGQVAHKMNELARLEALNDKKLISEEEFEAAQSEVKLLEIEVAIAKAQYETATTGKKPEEIKLIESQIDALEQEIAVLQELVETFSITAPFRGKVSRGFASDTLLTISDTSKLLAIIPIMHSDCARVRKGQQVKANANGIVEEICGRIVSLDNEIYVLNGREVFMGVVQLSSLPEGAVPGMIANCTIDCDPVSLLEYIQRFFSTTVL